MLGKPDTSTSEVECATPLGAAWTMVRATGAGELDTVIDVYVRATIAACGGNQSAAARILGITRWRLRRLLSREAA